MSPSPSHLPSTAIRASTLARIIGRKAYSTSTRQRLINVIDVPAPHSGNVRILSLNRQDARNAISLQLLAELGHEINTIHDEGETGPTRALVLASEVDSCFCAGADLKERTTFSPEQTSDFLGSLRSTFTSISTLPIPTISAVSSLALGGGLELALTTHMRVFTSTAIVGLPETRLGILPGAGGTYRLPGIVGLARARDMILTGRRVSGREAYFTGLCDRLVEVEEKGENIQAQARESVLQVAVVLAQEICAGGPIAIRQALRAVQECALGEVAENRAYDVVLKTEDRNEALAAFREKRKPVFQGR